MANKATLNKENIIAAIERHYGIVATVANHFGVTRQTIYSHIKADPEIQAALDTSRESFLDFAEGALVERIKKGDTTAIIFALKTQGKKRGYVERQEVTGAEGKAIPILITGMDMNEL